MGKIKAVACKKYSLPKSVEDEIIQFARQYGIERVTLFGSRARGTNRERSDIDLAAAGGNVDGFRSALDEEADTLLLFDVVNTGIPVSADLLAEIEKDGVTLYEKV